MSEDEGHACMLCEEFFRFEISELFLNKLSYVNSLTDSYLNYRMKIYIKSYDSHVHSFFEIC